MDNLRAKSTKRRVLVWVSGMLLGAALPFVLRHFTVDDALISGRYAHHLAIGIGYRFNPLGAATDGVTPLPWPWLLAPFAASGPLAAMQVGKLIGAGAWLLAAGALADTVDRIASRRAALAHLAWLVVFATPAVGAWAVSGMETGLVMAMATAAVLLTGSRGKHGAGATMAALCAAFRPEMLPWTLAMTLGHGRAWASKQKGASLVRRNLITTLFVFVGLAPFVMCAAARAIAFGRVAPLAVIAKPSDLHHGLVYVAAGALVTGPIISVIAPRTWLKLAGWPRVVLAAFAIHLASLAVAGGDWMPMSRLIAPVLPSLGIVFAHLAMNARAWSTVLRIGLCIAGQVFVFVRVGHDAAQVGPRREKLIDALADEMTASDRVATVDIGWVGASFRGAVIDLAGVTEPQIAVLAGGHTSKGIDEGWLRAAQPTALVLLLGQGQSPDEAWQRGAFARVVESRLSRMSWVRESFEPQRVIGGDGSPAYLLLRRRPQR